MARRSSGSGCLYQTKDKTWVYQYRVDGARKTKRFRLKSEAKAFIASLEDSRENDTAVMKLSEWLDQWLELYAKPSIKPSTYCSYEQLIRGHIKPQIGDLYLNQIRPEDMQAFFVERSEHGHLKTKGKLSPKTLNNLRNMLHLAFEQAVWNGLIPSNPIKHVRLPKIPKQEMRVLDREEQANLILAARMAPEPAAFGVIFALFTGLRIGELCALKWENVYPATHCIRISATRNRLPNFDDSVATTTSVKTYESPKTDNSRRTIFLMNNLWADFEKYSKIQHSIMKRYPGYNREGYVFCQENGDPYEPRTYQDLFKRCVRNAGIREANFHALRHTFATRSLEQGMDVVTLSRILGHANPSITLDKYGHTLDDQKKRSIEKLSVLYPGTDTLQAKQIPQPDEEIDRLEWNFNMGR